MIETQPDKRMEIHEDLCKTDLVMQIAFGLKLNELLTIIFIFAFYIGIFWIVMCELYEDLYDDTNYNKHPNIDEIDPNFITHFRLYDLSAWNTLIISTYFSLTSLTTVGLGDFRPVNNIERIVCSMILLFGVTTFSYVMS